MPITNHWADPEKTLLLVEFEGLFDWEAYYASMTEFQKMVTGVSHRVDCIADTRNGDAPSGNPLPHFRAFVNKLPDNIGVFVLVADKALYRQLTNIVISVYRQSSGRQIYMVYTLESAHALVEEARRGM